MVFWHTALLAGAATFAIPVVIHLIFRMRKRRVVFSSLRFLQESVLKESRRLKLRELILLLLRCAACILLALCFARPFRPDTVLAGSNGKPKEDVVLVVDDSPSLMAQEGASIRWNALLERVRAEIGSHVPGEHIGLVFASEPNRPESELTSNFGSVTTAMNREKTSARRGDLAQAMSTGVDLLINSAQSVRRMVLYTDLQSNQIEKGAWAAIAQKAAASGHGIIVQIVTPTGVQPARLPNLAVTEVTPKSDVWIEGRPVPFAVRVSNNGDSENPSVPIRLTVDGKILASRTVGLGPRSSTEIEMLATFPRPGEVFGQVEIDAHDAFPDDDKRLFALRLRDSLKVLVVEEKLGEKDAFLDEGYYVRMALDPKARGVESAPPPSSGSGSSGGSGGAPAAAAGYVQVQSVSVAHVTPDLYRNTDLIVLVGVPELSPKDLVMLEDAVREGRNLILFVGRSDGRLSDTFYNGPFWKNGHGLLPARPGLLYEGKRLEGKYHQLGEFKADHTLFKTFVGENEPNLRLPRYWRHFQANPADLKIGSEAPKLTEPKTPDKPDKTEKTPENTIHPAGEVLATFGDGSPFVMERAYGKGTVLMFNFAPRPEMTDLPKRKAFVPLLHQAVRHFAGVNTTSRRNLIVGDQFDFSDAGAGPETEIQLFKPVAAGKENDKTGESMPIKGNEHPLTDTLGVYTASFQKGNIQERTLWAVNIDPRESELNSEDLGNLRDIFASNSLENKGAGGAAHEWDDEQKSQAPDWRYFLVAALGCLLLEVCLRDFWGA